MRSSVIGASLVVAGLAGGIALGTGPLDQVDSVRTTAQPSGEQTKAAADPVEAGFVEEAGAGLVAGTLAGRTALVVVLPGAGEDDPERVRAALRAAGATVAGELGLTARLLDPGERQYAQSVSEEAAKGLTVPASDDVYARIGSVLARAYAGSGAVDPGAENIRTVVTTAGLVDQAQPPEGLADLLVVVGGPQRDADETGAAEVLGSLLTGWDAIAAGVVVTAPEASGFEGGLLHELRRAGEPAGVSTFDGLDAPAGAYVTAEVAAALLKGTAGSFGTGDGTSAARP